MGLNYFSAHPSVHSTHAGRLPVLKDINKGEEIGWILWLKLYCVISAKSKVWVGSLPVNKEPQHNL